MNWFQKNRRVIVFAIFAMIFFWFGRFASNKEVAADIPQNETKEETAKPAEVSKEEVSATPASGTETISNPSVAVTTDTNEPEISHTVSSITDGDTIKVSIDGKIDTIRLIGLDTPELNDSDPVKACEGLNAKNKAIELLNKQSVTLKADESQGERDKYNRLLRYVYLKDGTFFNQYMISQGFGREYTYKTAYQYQSDFRSAEAAAKSAGLGIWNAKTCQQTTSTVTPSPSVSTDSTSTSPSASTTNNSPTIDTGHQAGCDIKGNISTSGEKIYHVPSGSFYDRTVIDTGSGERWFCTEDEAVAAGWRRSLR